MDKRDNETNFNMKGNLLKYFIKQIIIIMSVTFVFFIASYYYFSKDFSLYIVWLMSVIGLLFLYVDLKFIIRINKMQQEIDDIKYILKLKRFK